MKASCISLDENHDPISVYIPKFLDSKTVEVTHHALFVDLQKSYPPPEVKDPDDPRLKRMQKMYQLFGGQVKALAKVGRYHLAWWFAIGH